MRIAVLGCGPAGLLAAHAADLAGHEVAIYSRKAKSEFLGAQYLHSPVPEITKPEPEFSITYLKTGTRAGYAAKAYGDPGVSKCSWDLRAGTVPAWSLSAAYEALWERYEDRIRATPFVNEVFLEELLPDFRMIFSSVPRFLVCRNTRHQFERTASWIAKDSIPVPENTILYCGLEYVGWHRASRIQNGEPQLEFAWPQRGATIVSKPQAHNCDCWKGTHVDFVGRYGRWERDVLSDSAYVDTANWLRP